MKEKKVIWITGASSGIGRAVAIKFAKSGWTVAASARRENLLNKLKEIDENIHPFPLDVTDIDKCKLVATNIINQFKKNDNGICDAS
jgi:NADP-dependent 3-hydroxy acid dehydrogenase YdfG